MFIIFAWVYGVDYYRRKAGLIPAGRFIEIWGALFSKSNPCLRASMLSKRYGWGMHFNDEGKIALYAKASPK
ncbi:DUF6157 family protein [Paenibacillus sp. FSL L8-0340]|uniref:DUF6157 family protein n=1 Tax=Paenibacillus sp. FSL L8-0340 TaxID=2954685 RepID=UPI003158A3E4